MSLTFKGTKIPGVVLRHGKETHDLQTWRTHFANVHGISEIRGGVGGRPLEFPVLLFKNFTTRRKLEEYVSYDLNWILKGENGVLRQTDVPDYEDCTFHGFIMHPPGPLPPRTLIGADDDGWFCYGSLLFFQLSPK